MFTAVIQYKCKLYITIYTYKSFNRCFKLRQVTILTHSKLNTDFLLFIFYRDSVLVDKVTC
jgi:hypothetical protein